MSIWSALCAVAEMVKLEVLGLVTEGPWAKAEAAPSVNRVAKRTKVRSEW
jgi:hypothetical protein